jgi:cytochrome b561|tara:strand:+ start:93 stop:980 length:888 start_codon:yes stop_codon:yes gene_type:complete
MNEIVLSLYSTNPGAWVSMGIVFLSVLTSWALNYSASRVRVFGTILAAVGCLLIAAWFFLFIINSGILENPKPNQTPLDSAKPSLLWIQSITALLTGLFLLYIASRQSKNTSVLALTAKNESNRYGKVSRMLHWTIAILFISLIPMGIFASMIPEDTEYRNAYYVVHKTIGVTVFLLVIVRLIWNRLSRRPSLDSALTSREEKLAHRAHNTLYFMMLAIPITGFMMTSYHGYETYFFFWEMQPLWEQSEIYQVWGGFHKYLLPYLLYIVLGAHILGALKHQFIDKHANAFKRMVS